MHCINHMININFGVVPSNGYRSITLPVIGATLGARVTVVANTPLAPGVEDRLILKGYVQIPDTLTITVINTGSPIITMPPSDFWICVESYTHY